MRVVNVSIRFAAILVATFLMCVPDSYAQRGRGGGGGGDGQGRSASNNGGGGGGNRSAGRPSSAPTGGGVSNPVGGALSRQSLSGSGSSNPGSSSSVRSTDGNRGDSNRAAVSQGTNNRVGANVSRDGAGVQPIVQPNTASQPKTSAPASGTGSNRSADAARRQESFFRGPTDRSADRDVANRNDANRGDNNRDDNDRNNLRNRDRDNRDNVARDLLNNNFNGRRDGRNGFNNGNDWDRFGRSVARNLAVRNGALPFSYGWYDNYRGNRWPGYSPFLSSRFRDRPNYWWGYTPANRLASYFVFGWNQPRYWAYGPGGNIYYQDDYVYYDGNRYQPVATYYQRIYDLAHSAPAIDPNQAEGMDWAPLGVFAAARQDANDNSSDDRTIQLAVNKDGVIAGTYFSPKEDKVYALTGMIDSTSQRAAWTFADEDQKGTVFETSVFNLTKPESTVMVHFGPKSDETQIWHLVRLEQPNQNAGANPQASAEYDLP